jgi:hypothetical protein
VVPDKILLLLFKNVTKDDTSNGNDNGPAIWYDASLILFCFTRRRTEGQTIASSRATPEEKSNQVSIKEKTTILDELSLDRGTQLCQPSLSELPIGTFKPLHM